MQPELKAALDELRETVEEKISSGATRAELDELRAQTLKRCDALDVALQSGSTVVVDGADEEKRGFGYGLEHMIGPAEFGIEPPDCTGRADGDGKGYIPRGVRCRAPAMVVWSRGRGSLAMTRAAGYVRVSTAEQAEGHSLDAQREQIREWVEREGWTLIGEPFEDVASGKRADRDGYQAMLDAAAAGRFDVLLVWKRDRLGRDLIERMRAEAALGQAGVRVVSVTEGELAADDPMAPVYAGIAEMERRQIGQRTRLGMRRAAETGRMPHRPPLGYRAEGEKGEKRWLIEETEAETVRRIFALYLEGVGVNRICRTLTDEGHRTRSGAQFSPRVVLDVLDNPAYIGAVRWQGEVVAENAHEPIIDRETWDRVRELRQARARTRGDARGRPPGRHLLPAGLLRCSRCGGGMSAKSEADRDRYRCARRHVHGDCTMPDVERRRIDGAVLARFERDALDVEGTIARLTEEARRRIAETCALAEQAERDAAKAGAQRERVEADYLSGELSAASHDRLIVRVDEEGKAARAEVERLRAQVVTLEAELAELDAETVVAERLAAIRQAVSSRVASAEGLDAVRAALTVLFDHFRLVVSDDGETTVEPVLRPDSLAVDLLDAETLAEVERLADAELTFEEIGSRLRLPEGWEDEPVARLALRKAALHLGTKSEPAADDGLRLRLREAPSP